MASLISKLLTNYCRLSLRNGQNFSRPLRQVESLLSSTTKPYSTVSTPYEIVDEQKDNEIAKGNLSEQIIKC